MTDPCRAALAELVRLKDMDPAIERHYQMGQSGTPYPARAKHEAEHDRLVATRNAAEPLAWAAARSALAQEAVLPRTLTKTECDQVFEMPSANSYEDYENVQRKFCEVNGLALASVPQPQDTKERT